MRKLIYSALVLFMFTYGTAAAQTTYKTAIEYNDYIVGEQDKVGDLIAKFNTYISDDDYATARTLLAVDMKKQAQSTLKNVKNMPGWKGDVALRDAAVALFQFYLDCIQNEYVEMLNIVSKDAAAINQADYDRLDVILKNIVDKENGLDAAFEAAQTNFASKNGFTLTE